MSSLFADALKSTAETFLNRLRDVINAEPAIAIAERLMSALNATGIRTEAHYMPKTGVLLVCLIEAADVGAATAVMQDECRALGLGASPDGKRAFVIHATGTPGPARIRLEWKGTQ
ncbi:hypothetical protein [Roseateles flavus]|uniref:Uncharacterized protein n=1 Tax=Roseateles flavus TaxID=3149041 RepID=A0ABV0GG70_9BURK